jgi:hypothetical protein
MTSTGSASSVNQYFIGDKADYKDYIEKKDVTKLPLKNLPMSYFPFFYENSEVSIEKMRKLVPLLENYTKAKDDYQQSNAANNTIDTDQLFDLLTILEEPYQAYNTYQINHIYIVVIILWIIISFYVLKIFNIWLRDYYTMFILCMILVSLIIASLWSLFVTNNSI